MKQTDYIVTATFSDGHTQTLKHTDSESEAYRSMYLYIGSVFIRSISIFYRDILVTKEKGKGYIS